LNRPLLVLTFLAAFSTTSFGQAKTTASRAGDLQVGGGFTTANSDYVTNQIRGFGFYSDFDLREHFGVEVDFHQLSDPNSAVYERTYEVGGRYLRHYGRFVPYAKALYGRGVFNFPLNEANLAYNMMVGGGGVDIAVHPRVNIRADFEYQDWLSGPGLHDGLAPTLITIGVAYHFAPGKLSTRE
jgi:hypothetical protein